MAGRFACALLLLAPQVDAQDYRGEDHRLARLELRSARVVDAIRLISEASGLNIAATGAAGEKTTSLFLQDLTAGKAVETLCKVSGLWFRRDEDTQTFRVMTTEEYQKDHIIYRKDEIRVFTLQHPNALTVAMSIEDLFGDRVELSLGLDSQQLDNLEGLSSFGGGMYGGSTGFGGAAGQGLYGGGYGGGGPGAYGPYGGGAYSRSGIYGGGLYSRGVGGYGGTTGGAGARGSRRGRDEDSEDLLDGSALTPDQLAELDRRLGPGGGRGAELETEKLRGLTRRDPTIYVTVNRQHNLIVVRTTDGETMEKIAALVNELDRPTPQVLLEMKILELTVGDSYQSVFDLSMAGRDAEAGLDDGLPRNPLVPGDATAPRNIAGMGNNGLIGGSFVYQHLDETIRARLQLLAGSERLRTVSTPMVLASNNRPARMFVGEERVLTIGARADIATSATGPSVSTIAPITEVRDVGNTLIVIPKINADRTVTLFISQDSSSVLVGNASIPVADADGKITDFPIDTVNTANMQATVVAKDGNTLAIGGLVRTELSEMEDKVPILGDIPILDLVFKDTIRSRRKSELILLITPHVLFTPADAKRVGAERMKELSRHPWFEKGDGAHRKLFDRIEERFGKSLELYGDDGEEEKNQ